MIAPLEKLIDWSSVQVMTLMMPAKEYDWRLEEALRGRLEIVRGVCESLKLTAMNLTMTQPAIPREKILLIEGIHDLVCSKDDIEDLWQSWRQPDIWRLPYGHVRIWPVNFIVWRMLLRPATTAHPQQIL
jgi:hypothetical protein